MTRFGKRGGGVFGRGDGRARVLIRSYLTYLEYLASASKWVLFSVIKVWGSAPKVSMADTLLVS